MRKLMTHLAWLSVGAVVLIACGEDDDPPEGSDQAEEPAAVEEVAEEPAELEEEAETADIADDPFAGEDPFADEGALEDDLDAADDGREGPGALPAELSALVDLPPGFRLDHVETFEGPNGPEYSIDASYHEGSGEQFAAARDHYRSILPDAGFEIVEEYAGDEVAELYLLGHGLEGSMIIDVDMGSVWVNAFLAPEW